MIFEPMSPILLLPLFSVNIILVGLSRMGGFCRCRVLGHHCAVLKALDLFRENIFVQRSTDMVKGLRWHVALVIGG